jgi:hypothetical protein
MWTVIDCHSLGFYTVILLPLLPFSAKNDNVTLDSNLAAIAVTFCQT